MNRMFKNIYFCIVFPMLIAGIINIGMYYLFIQVSPIYPIAFDLLLSGALGYIIGSLVRNNYKWEKE